MKKLLLLISLFSALPAVGMDGAAEAGVGTAAAGRKSETDQITLKFTDEETRKLERKFAVCSQTLEALLADFAGAAEQPIVPLLITAAEYDLIVPYWEHIYHISQASKNQIQERLTQLVDQLQRVTDKEQLGKILNCADYIGISILTNCVLELICNKILSATPFTSFIDVKELIPTHSTPYHLNDNLQRELTKLLIQEKPDPLPSTNVDGFFSGHTPRANLKQHIAPRRPNIFASLETKLITWYVANHWPSDSHIGITFHEDIIRKKLRRICKLVGSVSAGLAVYKIYKWYRG